MATGALNYFDGRKNWVRMTLSTSAGNAGGNGRTGPMFVRTAAQS